MLYRGKTVYVVGGGTAACEEAEYLARIAARVILVVRRNELRCPPYLQRNLQEAANVELRFNTVLESVAGERAIATLTFKDTHTGAHVTETHTEGSCGVFVMVGHTPEVELVRPYVETVDGAIVTDAHMRTKTAGLFAAGDVRNTVLRQVITAASDGAIAATSAVRYLDQRE